MAASSGSWRKFDKNGNLTPESKEFQKRNLSGKGNTFGGSSGPTNKNVSERSSDTGGGRTSSSRLLTIAQ